MKLRYEGATIESSPSEKFPDMVTITRTNKRTKPLQNKRFKDVDTAKLAIEQADKEYFVQKVSMQIQKEIINDTLFG